MSIFIEIPSFNRSWNLDQIIFTNNHLIFMNNFDRNWPLGNFERKIFPDDARGKLPQVYGFIGHFTIEFNKFW